MHSKLSRVEVCTRPIMGRVCEGPPPYSGSTTHGTSSRQSNVVMKTILFGSNVRRALAQVAILDFHKKGRVTRFVARGCSQAGATRTRRMRACIFVSALAACVTSAASFAFTPSALSASSTPSRSRLAAASCASPSVSGGPVLYLAQSS